MEYHYIETYYGGLECTGRIPSYKLWNHSHCKSPEDPHCEFTKE